MPDIDVDDVLDDEDFVDDSLVCQRNVQVISSGGVASLQSSMFPFSGVVTSEAGDMLERTDSGERITGGIVIHTRRHLRDGRSANTSGNRQHGAETADIITWGGRQWTVKVVNNWSKYGRGFVAAHCEPIQLGGSI